MYKPNRFPITALFVLLPLAACAQQTRTWLASNGDDTNGCFRIAPCKSFAATNSKTSPGGEVDVVDAADYGSVVVTHSMTLDGSGIGAILVSGSAGITVFAQPTDVVVIRNLKFLGNGGLYGIKVISGGTVRLENVTFNGVPFGIIAGFPFANSSSPTSITIKNSVIEDCAGSANGQGGITVDSLTSPVSLVADKLTIHNCGTAIAAADGAKVVAWNSDLSSNTVGVQANSGAVVSLDSSQVSLGGAGLVAMDAGTQIRLTNTSVLDNSGAGLTALGGGSIVSFVTNRILGNNPNGAPTSSVYQK